jgi:hypothetical protein
MLDERKIPEWFAPAHWEVVDISPGGALLSDACVVAISDQGEPGALLRFGASYSEVYLPVSDSQVLVGTREGSQPQLDLGHLNHISAEIAFSFLYAPKCGDEVRELTSLIGTGNFIVTDEQLDEFVDEGTIWEGRKR